MLKIDKSFIDAFNTDERKSVLTATIIKLAEDLDLRPVAEGIERTDQLEKLLELHCDLGQGYYFARPLPIEGVEQLLTARSATADRPATGIRTVLRRDGLRPAPRGSGRPGAITPVS
jgi:EAL domain-containing protein (putative c-di-GMP-specific phosphodiesterase class I)